jgi:3-methylcrotonyl-CoA carboxylase alpha subunit
VRLRYGNERRDVTVREGADGLEVRVGPASFSLAVKEVAPGTYVLREGTRVETFHCVRDGSEIHLSWRGVVYRLREEAEGSQVEPRSAAGGLEAPMPGKVIAVMVAPGQAVRRGDGVLVVEAMKMENTVRAPRDGTVRSLAVTVGDMVSPGMVLVEIE